MSEELNEVTSKKKVSMNMDDMTFGEMEMFEDVTGLIMSDAVRTEIVRDKDGRPVPDPDDPKGRPLKEAKMGVKAMMGMVYISMHRDDPDVTWQDVKNIKLSDVDLEVSESDEEGKDEAVESE